MENWTEKYRPRHLDDIVGNDTALQQLRQWAQQWQQGQPKDKAVILSGKAGIGKTSAAHALANDYGWQTIELNASDARSKDVIRRTAFSGAVNETFSPDGIYMPSKSGGGTLVIIDEADNLYETQGDRGGTGAIIDTIRQTRQPVILIVNDYYQLTRGAGKPLKSLCRHIQFKPVGDELIETLQRISQAEGVQVDNDVIRFIANHADGDVRGAINDLQTLCQSKQHVDMSTVARIGSRNREQQIFSGLRRILRARTMQDADAAARDIDEAPPQMILWIDENLPVEYQKPRDLARAYNYLAAADVFLGRTHRRQHYGLWKYACNLMYGGVAVAKTRLYRGYNRYDFPSWLRKMSASKAKRGRRRHVSLKIGRYTHMSGDKTRDLIPYLEAMLSHDEELAAILTRRLDLSTDDLTPLVGGQAAKNITQRAEKGDIPTGSSDRQQSLFDY
ncbi:MAG: replication factor C large subunit [Thermoplasmatota archaeon]